jgi:hypothetical protein
MYPSKLVFCVVLQELTLFNSPLSSIVRLQAAAKAASFANAS